jgi:hypothetical protein
MSPIYAAVLTLGAMLLLVYVLPLVTGFRAQRPAEFRGKGPILDPHKHLSGPILCEGVIYGPTGHISARFVAEMEGVWQGNKGVLRERFRYDSGRVQNREWRMTLGSDGTLRAEADDVVGFGKGRIEGPAVQMLYALRLPADAGGHVLNVTDWMYLCDNGTIMNRSQFTKFGFKVAELVATLRPMPV